jgi:mono/diheme cytochrome c family protein
MRKGASLLGVTALTAITLAACAHHGAAGAAASASAAPTELSASAGRGRALFNAKCIVCHSSEGPGAQIGGPLTGENKKHSAAQIRAIIDDPSPPMPKIALSAQDEDDIIAYVERL